MVRLSPARSADALHAFCSVSRASPLLAPDMNQHDADARWMALDPTGHVLARCSLWWRSAPPYRDERVGLIGHYWAADHEAALRLLAHACEELAGHGCTLAIGPMDGSTWASYRFVTERGAEPAFFLEPNNPGEWPAQFLAAGFEPLASYFSTLSSDLGTNSSRNHEQETRFRDSGIRIRCLALEDWEAELRRIYDVVAAAFRNNFLYTPISYQRFAAQYRPLRWAIRQELTQLAERNNSAVGFVLGLPDVLQLSRGRTLDTVVAKTLCVLPEFSGRGLGSLLIARMYDAARALGFRRVIHALMHEENVSRRINAAQMQPFRRYALFARSLRSLP